MSQCCPKNACRHRGPDGPTKVIGHGWFPVRHGRRRRYRCVGGGGTFSGRIDTAYYRFRCSPRTFDRVAHMAVEGMSRAAIARIEDVGWNTINRWLSKAGDFAHRFNDARTREIELIELQADEIRPFAPGKARPTWVFISMEVCSKLWVSTVVGPRCYRNTRALFNDTIARGIIVGVPLIATDGLKFYARVVRRLFGPACIYGQVVKTWRTDRVIKVERRPVIGSWRRLETALEHSQDPDTLNTADIERLNLTLRRSVSYLARRSACALPWSADASTGASALPLPFPSPARRTAVWKRDPRTSDGRGASSPSYELKRHLRANAQQQLTTEAPHSAPCASPHAPVAGNCGDRIRLDVRYQRGAEAPADRGFETRGVAQAFRPISAAGAPVGVDCFRCA
jgi:IS1 family transposase